MGEKGEEAKRETGEVLKDEIEAKLEQMENGTLEKNCRNGTAKEDASPLGKDQSFKHEEQSGKETKVKAVTPVAAAAVEAKNGNQASAEEVAPVVAAAPSSSSATLVQYAIDPKTSQLQVEYLGPADVFPASAAGVSSESGAAAVGLVPMVTEAEESNESGGAAATAGATLEFDASAAAAAAAAATPAPQVIQVIREDSKDPTLYEYPAGQEYVPIIQQPGTATIQISRPDALQAAVESAEVDKMDTTLLLPMPPPPPTVTGQVAGTIREDPRTGITVYEAELPQGGIGEEQVPGIQSAEIRTHEVNCITAVCTVLLQYILLGSATVGRRVPVRHPPRQH